ncbi:MAG: hypothetical protein MR051_06220 [Lentisphaeria bacterium]|nr:hypothetical protein [Lentisphaeria bacterium]
MKKWLMLTIAMFVAVIMTGCGDKDIDLVKNGVFPDDSARTVEQRITARYKKLKWKSYTTEDNHKVVEATAVVRLTDEGRKELKRMAYVYRDSYPHDGDIYSARFVINADHKSFIFIEQSVKAPDTGKKRPGEGADLPERGTMSVPKKD